MRAAQRRRGTHAGRRGGNLVATGTAAADEPPTPGTSTTRCLFDPQSDALSPGITYCSSLEESVLPLGCILDPDLGPLFVFEILQFTSAREYHGYALIPGVKSGDTVSGLFSQVRPQARLTYDSGQHLLADFVTYVPVAAYGQESC